MNTPFVPQPDSSDRALAADSLEQKIKLLNHKLVGFAVIDHQQQILGTVKELRLDAQHQPTLVIAPPGLAIDQTLEFNTRSIAQVDTRARVILVQLAKRGAGILENSLLAGDQMTTVDSEIDRLETARQTDAANRSEVREDLTISLLEERLKVDYQRRKIGEVLVRKTVETRIVEVPVRYERLIVEQVSPEHKQIADVRLESDISSLSEQATEVVGHPIVSGEFASPQVASQVLYAIAQNLKRSCRRVRIEIELEDESFAEICQQWMSQHHEKF